MNRRVAGLTAALALLLGAPAADAATVSVSGTTVTYQAAPGEVNKPLVDENAGAVVFGDSAKLVPGAGCAAFGETGVTCSGAAISAVIVNLGDRDDNMMRNVLEGEVPAKAKLTVDGGPGKDFIIGTTGNDALSGGTGDDSVYGSGGRDVLKGGAGKDRLTGFGTLEGGAGNDFLEAFYGFGQYKSSPTKVLGGAGNDRALTGNKVGDSVDCGAGKDSASTTDRRGRDTFKSNCETRPR